MEWIRFLLFLFRQDQQDYHDFFRLRRGVFRPKAALSFRSCWSCLILLFKIRIHASYFSNSIVFIWSDWPFFGQRPRSCETTLEWRMSNVEWRMAESLQASPSATTRQVAQSLLNRQNTFLRHSLFLVRYSIFALLKFLILIRLAVFWPEAVLVWNFMQWRMANGEWRMANVEGWNRFAPSF